MSDKNRTWVSTLSFAGLAVAIISGIGVYLFEKFESEKKLKQKKPQKQFYDVRDDSNEESASQSSYNTCTEGSQGTESTLRSCDDDLATTVGSLRSCDDDFASAVGSLTICDDVEDLGGNVDSVPQKVLSINDFEVEDLDKMLDGSPRHFIKSKGVILDRHEADPEDPDILWLMAKLCHKKGEDKPEGDDGKLGYYISGGAFADRALARASGQTKGHAHKWKAICAGSEGLLGDVKLRVKKALIFRENILEALKLLPEDLLLHHLIGVFYYELANLGFIERMACASVGLSSDYDSAIEHLFKAEDLSGESPWKENWFYIAKCFIGNRNVGMAEYALKKAAAAPIKTEKEVRMQEDILVELDRLDI